MDLYASLQEQGKLANLTPSIKQDKYDVSDFMPAILHFFTDEQGQIHGLTPTFTGTALYYNKKMFQTNGIPFPTDAMTWDDVFLLARRFSGTAGGKEPQFGYYDKHAENPFLMALYIGESSGLSLYSNNKFTFSSKSWDNVFQRVMDCYKSHACIDKSHLPSSAATDKAAVEKRSYPFLQGNIAMAVGESSLYRMLTKNKAGYPDLEWGIVSLPVSADQPGLGNGIAMNDIFSIPTSSGQPKEAWELIKYVCGQDYAKLLPSVNPDDLPARLPAEWPDVALKSFYKLHRIANTMINTLRSLPKPVIAKMDELSNQYVADLLSNKTKVPDALAELQSELQAALDASAK
jgi:multiple sugar transport system substrate-binding protein